MNKKTEELKYAEEDVIEFLQMYLEVDSVPVEREIAENLLIVIGKSIEKKRDKKLEDFELEDIGLEDIE